MLDEIVLHVEFSRTVVLGLFFPCGTGGLIYSLHTGNDLNPLSFPLICKLSVLHAPDDWATHTYLHTSTHTRSSELLSGQW